MIEGVLDLQLACPYPSQNDHLMKIKTEAVPFLLRPLRAQGCVHIRPYPPSAFLSQLAFRVLDRLNMVERHIADTVHAWARQEVNKEVALLSAHSRIADPLNLGYALILATMSASDEQTSPEDKRLSSHALGELFSSQNPSGFWPYGRPLFHYPQVGNAHCYEYEFLTQLLICEQLRADLLPYLANIGRAAQLLESTSFDLKPERASTVVGWASGHHPQIKGPESWSTACVYDFAHAFDRLIGEAIRRAIFEELDVIYWPPRPPKDPATDEFASQLLDAHLAENPGPPVSLKQTIAECFVYPIAREASRVGKGGKLQKEKAPMSAIFFGPPGTSKTDLGRHISEYIGWPLLSVDPSYLVQDGLDKIQARANKLFRMLASTEQVVVLLDEFDEMGRDREGNDELLSRFITTAMLPKLANINSERKIVFLLATNYISGFDQAFSRGGRFDMRVQVLPPTSEAKFGKWPRLREGWDALTPQQRNQTRSQIENLTYLECEHLAAQIGMLVGSLSGDELKDQIMKVMEQAEAQCTLTQSTRGGSDWKKACENDKQWVRIDRRYRI
jgi:hypothetical protein